MEFFFLFSMLTHFTAVLGEKLSTGYDRVPREKETIDSLPAMIQIYGDPHILQRVKVTVTTSTHTHNLDLERAESILHPKVKVISLDSDGQSEFREEEVEPYVHEHANQFFHNLNTGTIVSLMKQNDGKFHMEGYLDHVTIIAPPGSTSRHKRDAESQDHIVYTPDVDLDRDWKNSEPLEKWAGAGKNEIVNSILNKDGSSLKSKWEELHHFAEQHRHLDIDVFDDKHDEDEHEDDYLEVPSIFDDEESWKAHQSQAESESNEVPSKEELENNDDTIFSKTKATDVAPTRRRKRSVNKNQGPLSENLYIDGKKQKIESETELRFAGEKLYFQENQRNEATSDETNVNNVIGFGLDSYLVSHLYRTQIPRPSYRKQSVKESETVHLHAPRHIETFEEFLKRFSGAKRLVNSHKINRDSPSPGNSEASNFERINSRDLKGQGLTPKVSRVKRQVYLDWTAQDVPGVSYMKGVDAIQRENASFTVEVMAMVDARTYKEFNYDWKALQIFLVHFWQSVNARFRTMVDPNVHLKLKSITKVLFSGYQPFIENNRISADSTRVDVNGVLSDFKSFIGDRFESNPKLPEHDIAILMTGEDLCKKRPDGTWSKKARGIAYVRGACISSRRFMNQTYDVGVAEVGRSFRGVLTTTHEVGHLLGAFHDGEKNASDCPLDSGHLMSNAWSIPYMYNRFSNCSKMNFKNFMEKTWYSQCLLTSEDNHSTAYTFPKKLPGQVFTLTQQCEHYIEGIPCKDVAIESQCGRLCCEKWSQPFPSKEPAADGTYCGPGKMCYNGECLLQGLIPW